MLEALEIAAHRYSYRDLAEAIRQFGSDPLSDLRELFRRMAFNILVGNDDDHLRNHAFLFDGRGWRLSPLYDVISRPHVGSNGRLILAVGDRGHEATLANALTGAATYGLDHEEAATLLGKEKGKAFVLAGGTDLLVKMKAGVLEPDLLVDIKAIKGMKEIYVQTVNSSTRPSCEF